MKVRILSGNYAGCIEEVEQLAAESMLSTGYAERVPDEKTDAPAVASPAPEPDQPAESVKRAAPLKKTR